MLSEGKFARRLNKFEQFNTREIPLKDQRNVLIRITGFRKDG